MPPPHLAFSGPVALFAVLGIVAIIVVAFLVAALRKQERRLALQRLAAERRFTFALDDPFGVTDTLAEFPLMQHRGSGRKAANFLWGDHRGRQVLLFEYEYTVSGGDSSTTYSHCCCTWRLPLAVAPLAVRPQRFFDSISDWFTGRHDVNVDVPSFDDAYHVTGPDPDAVREFLDPSMIEFLRLSFLQYLEISGDLALVYRRDHLTPDGADALLSLADGIDQRLRERAPEATPTGSDAG